MAVQWSGHPSDVVVVVGGGGGGRIRNVCLSITHSDNGEDGDVAVGEDWSRSLPRARGTHYYLAFNPLLLGAEYFFSSLNCIPQTAEVGMSRF